MKKIVVILAIFMLLTIAFGGNFEVKDSCVRIHIRANSNASIDQNVKFEVKDAIVSYLTPIVSKLDSSDKAKQEVNLRLNQIEQTANNVLKKRGYSYQSKVYLTQEKFPARSYGEYTLQEGIYDALIVELGQASGDNWWCVLFPPLCFSPKGEGETIQYKSALKELCDKVFGT